MTNYFESFLLMPNVVEQRNLSSLIEEVVSQEDNMDLVQVPYFEEVVATLATILKESTPGSDGFGSTFYVYCWEFIKEDIVEAIEEIFLGRPLP